MSKAGETKMVDKKVEEVARQTQQFTHLQRQVYESLLARHAKYADPQNFDFEFERAGKFERHAINAALEIRELLASTLSMEARGRLSERKENQ